MANQANDHKTITELYALWQSLQPLADDKQQQLWQKLRLEWNYNSNHIEGNTLTYGETMLLLIHGRTSGNHLLREYEETKAHDVSINYLQELAKAQELITEADVRDLNKLLLKEPFWQVAQTTDGQPRRKWIEPGQYKTQTNHVYTATGEIFYFASPVETPAKMQEFLSWLTQELSKPINNLPQLLAKLHHDFIVIHPFDDGNGRLVRLLINYVLLRDNYPPIVIKYTDRDKYLTALQLADAGNLQPLTTFIAVNIIHSLNLAIASTN